jgi:hypothetical protein
VAEGPSEEVVRVTSPAAFSIDRSRLKNGVPFSFASSICFEISARSCLYAPLQRRCQEKQRAAPQQRRYHFWL